MILLRGCLFSQLTCRSYFDEYLLLALMFHQTRLQITDAVVAARILNATLVVPKLDQKSFWKDSRFVIE